MTLIAQRRHSMLRPPPPDVPSPSNPSFDPPTERSGAVEAIRSLLQRHVDHPLGPDAVELAREGLEVLEAYSPSERPTIVDP